MALGGGSSQLVLWPVFCVGRRGDDARQNDTSSPPGARASSPPSRLWKAAYLFPSRIVGRPTPTRSEPAHLPLVTDTGRTLHSHRPLLSGRTNCPRSPNNHAYSNVVRLAHARKKNLMPETKRGSSHSRREEWSDRTVTWKPVPAATRTQSVRTLTGMGGSSPDSSPPSAHVCKNPPPPCV